MSEKNALGANRREEYRKVAELFLKCEDISEAHRMSAMVFGLEKPFHLKGDCSRETDSMNKGVYEEPAMELVLKPRVRTYREKSRRSAIRERSEAKEKTRRQMLEFHHAEDCDCISGGSELMKELEILLNRRWVLKSEDKDLYYRVRDSIGEIRRFATDKMGCQVIENSLLVKLEKIPAIPEGFMGIEDFTSKEEYAFFCVLLMFLEDKDAEEQFILSQLTEYIAANVPGQTVDWTLYTSRRRLVKVLRYAVSQGILKVTDGSDDVFMDEASGEVLYENTGASRYFMRNFSRDITEYTKPEDFRESDWFEMNEERGIARRHRVYKRLLFSPGMYRNAGAEEDFEYLKYYGRRLTDDLEQNFDCRVHIHKGSAFFLAGEDCHIGAVFPGNNAVSDILLLCCGKIREKVERGEWKNGSDDTIRLEKLEFEQMLREVKEESGTGFTKNYREMPEGEFVREITENMERWTFIRCDDREHLIIIYPSAGKLAGRYPDDYAGGNAGEQQIAGK